MKVLEGEYISRAEWEAMEFRKQVELERFRAAQQREAEQMRAAQNQAYYDQQAFADAIRRQQGGPFRW